MPGGRPREKTQADSVKSVIKVLDILEHLGSSQSAIGLSDLSRATGLSVSTAFRLLQTLMVRGYVEQEKANRTYFLGPRIFQMGSAYLRGSDLATIARPHLEALRDEVGETAYLVTFSQGEIVRPAWTLLHPSCTTEKGQRVRKSGTDVSRPACRGQGS